MRASEKPHNRPIQEDRLDDSQVLKSRSSFIKPGSNSRTIFGCLLGQKVLSISFASASLLVKVEELSVLSASWS